MHRLLLLVMLIVFAVAGRGVPIQEASAQTCPGGVMTQEWIDCKEYVLHACAFAPPSSKCEDVALMQYAQFRHRQQQQMQCPGTHPIKGNFTTYNGEHCIFHVPGGQFYNVTKPEKCYATSFDAILKDAAGTEHGTILGGLMVTLKASASNGTAVVPH